MKHLTFTVLLLLIGYWAYGKEYHVDPVNGSMTNDGSMEAPWSTLEAVIAANLIEHYRNSPIPYEVTNNVWAIHNQGAPIQGGDTIILHGGKHGNIHLVNFNNKEYITVMAAFEETPILAFLKLTACTKWRFQGVDISSEPYGNYLTQSLVVMESHNWHGPAKLLELKDSHIYSTITPWETEDDWISKAGSGVYVRDADSCDVINNVLENINFGIRLVSDHLNCIGNSIVNFSGDGIRISGSSILVESNTIKNCYKVDENHDDGIQSFTTNGLIVDDNIVRGNIIINYEDPNQPLLGELQGIGCFDGIYHNWIVENNLIIVDHYHGISFYGADNCSIVNNTVLDPTPSLAPGPTWIKVTDAKDGTPSTGCTIKNNVANSFDLTGEVGNNVVVTSLSEYASHFVDYTNHDYKLLSTSGLVDSADDDAAPNTDLEGVLRPQGLHSDVGCYEYIMPSSVSTIQEINLQIFPNPVANELVILGDTEGLSFSILDMSGHSLAQKIDHSRLNVASLPKGLYILQIRTSTGKYYFKKWVKE